MLREGGSLLTMTCLSAVRAVPHYEVMGLAKASLTARVRYLAAATSVPATSAATPSPPAPSRPWPPRHP